MNFLLDVHLHTTASGHAYSSVMEYVTEAINKGLKLIAVTDHAPSMPGACSKLHFINLRVIPDFINGLEILKGVELNILDIEGHIDLSENILRKLQVRIASLHPSCIEAKPGFDYTQTIINAMSNPYVDIIGHLGDPKYMFDVTKVVSAAKALGKVLEINNESFNPLSSRVGGNETINKLVCACRDMYVPIIASSDAHFHVHLGDFSYIKQMIIDSKIPKELILNTSVEVFKNTIGLK